MAQQKDSKAKAAKRRAKKAEEARKDREWLINSIGPKLQEKIDQMKEWHKTQSRDTLCRHYQLGQIVKEVYDDEENQGGEQRYGTRAMAKICAALPWCKPLLNETLRFVRAYSPEEVESLVEQRLGNGQPVTWTHIRHLLEVKDKPQRENLLKRTIEESWTCDDLAQEVNKVLLKKSDGSPGRGRPRARPRNLDQVIRQQEKLANEFLERAEEVWSTDEHSLTNHVSSLSSDQRTEETAQKLKQHAEKMRRLAEQAIKSAEEAESAYQHFMITSNKPKAREDAVGTTPPQDAPTPEPQASVPDKAEVAQNAEDGDSLPGKEVEGSEPEILAADKDGEAAAEDGPTSQAIPTEETGTEMESPEPELFDEDIPEEDEMPEDIADQEYLDLQDTDGEPETTYFPNKGKGQPKKPSGTCCEPALA